MESSANHSQGESKSFGACLDLLRGPTNEHRFVGLLFLAKYLQTSSSQKKDECVPAKATTGPTVRHQIFKSVGISFLQRLYTAKLASDEKGVDMEQTYRSLSLNILSFLMEEEDIASNFVDLVPALLTGLHSGSSNLFKRLQCLCRVCRAQPLVVVRAVVEGVYESTSHVACIAQLLKNSQTESTVEISSCCMYLLSQVCVYERQREIIQLSDVDALVCAETLSFIFATVTINEVVFQAMGALVYLLVPEPSVLNLDSTGMPSGSSPHPHLEKSQEHSMWEQFVRVGLRRMMENRIPLHHRADLFRLLHFMLCTRSSNWAVERKTSSMGRQKCDFITLMAKSTMIEARVTLDEVARLIIDEETTSSESEDKENLMAKSRMVLDVLGSCYGIVEHCVRLLLIDDDREQLGSAPWQNLPAETLLQLRDSLVGVVNTAVDLLDYFGKSLKSNARAFEKQNKLDVFELLAISFRLLSTWMSVDADSILNQVLNIVPSLESILLSCPIDLDATVDCRKTRISHPFNGYTVIEFSLPTIAIIIDDCGARDDFSGEKITAKLEEFRDLLKASANLRSTPYGNEDGHLDQMITRIMSVLSYA